MAEGDGLLSSSIPDNTVRNTSSYGTSVFFNGQISEAISATKCEQKLLIVYIAGDNEDSRRLDQITWEDSKVHESISSRFVALRLHHGSSDAAHFAAIFPYQQIPSIAILNHNGMMLKAHGGYISPSDFLQTLEQLVAVQSSMHASETSKSAISPPNNPSISEDTKTVAEYGTSWSPSSTNSLPSSSRDISENPTVLEDSENLPQNNLLQRLSSSPCHESQNPSVSEDSNTFIQNHSITLAGLEESPIQNSAVKANEQVSLNSGKILLSQDELHSEKKQILDSLHLQVRLTNGDSIRKNFKFEDHLITVKEFVDCNRTDGDASYSLAVLYPRKLFKQEDMEKTLKHLNVEDRATLVLVANSAPITQDTSSAVERSSSNVINDTSNSGWIWKQLSYLNPLSYFKGSNTETDNDGSGGSSWQYDPDPAFAQGLRAANLESRGLNMGMNNGDNNNGRNNQNYRTWGGNIHTLKRDDDDENRFKRGNAFWNGNSTEYGGDDSKNS